MRAIFFSFILALLCIAAPASSATINFDISDLAGFQQNGISGTAGNGIVFLSPDYTVGFGDTVDFGIAYVAPDPPDLRYGPCVRCVTFAEFLTFYLVDNVGGLSSPPFDLLGTGQFDPQMTGIVCQNDVCGFAQYDLTFTLPPNVNGIQFAFEGSSLTIAPPVPEPSTWAMLLIGFAGIGAAMRWKSALPRSAGSWN